MREILEPVKLTEWKNEPTLRQLKQDFSNAQSAHQAAVSKIDDWKDAYHCRGKYGVPKLKGRSSVQPQVIRKQAEWRYAALSEPFLSSTDLFEVSPVSHEDRAAARQNSLVLNNQFQTKIDKTRFIDTYIRTAVDEGTVIVKLGWDYKEGQVEEPAYIFEYLPVPPEAQEQAQQQLEQLLEMQAKEPDSFNQIDPAMKEMVLFYQENGQLVIPSLVQETTALVTKAIVNKPTLEVCDYRSIVIDPTCEGDMSRANFVIYSFLSSMSELKKAGIYTNLDKINLDTDSILGMPDEMFTQQTDIFFKDKPRRKLMVYEYWGYWDIDGTGETKPIVATWVGDTLIRLEENPYPDGEIPFVVVSYLPVKRSVYGEPDGALLIDHQRIIGALTRGIIDLMGKSANSQTAIPQNMLNAINKRRFENGEDYEYNPNINPAVGIYQHKYPEVPNSAMGFIQYMAGEAEALTGVKAFSTGGGITGEGMGESATGVRSAMDAASKREMGILRRLSNGIIQIGRKIISMNAVFLDEEEIIRITNDEFVKVRRDDLAGNFDLRLTISTAEADNEKAKELSFMLQTMGNNMAPEMSQIILGEIARLRNMPDLAHVIENYKPEPDPMEQELKQLQLEKLKAEIEALRADAQEAQSKGQVNMSKIPTEQAKANKLQNEADQKSLDFMEQYQGIDQNKKKELEDQKANNALTLAGQAQDASLDNELLKAVSNGQRFRQSQESN